MLAGYRHTNYFSITGPVNLCTPLVFPKKKKKKQYKEDLSHFSLQACKLNFGGKGSLWSPEVGQECVFYPNFSGFFVFLFFEFGIFQNL